MRSEFKKLLKDTVNFLRQEEIPLSAPKQHRVVATKKKEPLPQPPIEKTQPIVPKPTSSTIVDKIKKHLPHLPLIDPPSALVALMANKNEPFFQNLCKAIEERFCKVEWVDDKTQGLEKYSLVLSMKKLPLSHQILLAPIQHYQNNPNEKKQLWLQICHHLSQRSS